VIICAVLEVLSAIPGPCSLSEAGRAAVGAQIITRRSPRADDMRLARKIGCDSRSSSAYDMLSHHQCFIWAIFLESAFLVAVGAAVLGLIHWKNRKKRLPFTQKILRPPGESLRIRLIELDEKLNDRRREGLPLQLNRAFSPLDQLS
jgi:hypothetical protein